jgi:hypothetical protein
MVRTFTKESFGRWFSHEAETTDGRVWRWTSNGHLCPLDACREYGIPCDAAAQRAALDRETATFIRAYRKRDRRMSAEERFEARAAFGAGTTVVNILTGRRTRL